MPITKNALKKLRTLFLDEVVTIYLKDMNIVTVDENNQEMKISPMAQGYCVDIDQDYIYLGLPDGTIIKSVNHDIAGIMEVELMINQLLDAGTPMNDEDVH